MIKNLFSLDNISVYQFSKLLDLTFKIKEKPKLFKDSLSGFIVAGVFENTSILPKMSFQVAVSSLKGENVFLSYSNLQTKSKKLSLVSCKCLEQWADGIVIETNNHKHILEMGEMVKIPIINANSGSFSPCQALADFFTIKEHYRDLTDIKLAVIGNQKNISHSLLLASATAGTYIHVAAPPKNQPEQKVIDRAEEKGKDTHFNYKITENPLEAASDSDIIYYSYTYSGTSSRTEKNFLLNDQLLSSSKKDILFMFSPTSEEWEKYLYKKIPSNQSLIFSQADNRLHITKAIMVSLIKEKKREI
ncbi:MAG: ornithine carbamoyltransferase [Acidobacteriota bacterium]